MKGKPWPPTWKSLTRSYAAVRRSSGIKLAKYVLCPLGLTNSVGDVTVDGYVALIQSHPDANICLCPMAGKPQPTESAAWYYADCLAYEHDIPVIVLPPRGDFDRFGYRFAHSGQTTSKAVHVESIGGRPSVRMVGGISAKQAVKEYYCESLCAILENVREIRQGPLTFVQFRHDSESGTVNLPYASRYAPAAQEVHVYAVALRQVDALSEFLCYYRVIESATASNGKVWIASSLDSLRGHDFGYIAIAHERVRRPRSLLSIWKQRAVRRLSELRSRYGSTTEIARYLYNTTRCGIAHGRQIVRADITPSYFEVAREPRF